MDTPRSLVEGDRGVISNSLYELIGEDMQVVLVGLDYSIERAGDLKSMFFGGEGFFLATLSGTGTVFLQSLFLSRLAERILKFAPRPSSD